MSEDKRKTLFVILSLTIVTLAVFWQVHNFSFTNYDDDSYVSKNKHVMMGFTFDNFLRTFTELHYYMWHPVTTLTNMLDYKLFGLNAGGHHLTNLFFHITNTLFLFGILKKMTSRIWPSAFAAALFALHPLNVESVAWVAERKNVTSTFFWMLTIAAYIRYVNSARLLNYLLVILSFILALMSKPSVVTLPFALLLLDYWPLNRTQIGIAGKINRQRWQQLVGEKILLFMLSAVSCVVTIVAQKSGDVLKLNEYFPLHVRLSNALVAYILYIGKMVYPANLAVFYPHPSSSLPVWQPIVSFLVLSAISIGAIRLARVYPYLPVGWFWFLGTLVPVIGLVQAGEQRMADRYAYVPLIGLFIIIAWGTSDLTARWKFQKIILGLSAILVIAVLSICTFFQTSHWCNSKTLFEHALKVTKQNHLAYNKVAYSLMEEGKYNEAINLIQQALRLKPYYVEALNNLGFSYTKLNRWQQAVEAYERAVTIRPRFANAQYNLGIAYLHLGRSIEAINAFKKATSSEPDYAEAYFFLGIIHTRLGYLNEAVKDFEQTVKIKPDFAQAHYYLGTVYGKLGRSDDEMKAYLQAIKIKPDYAEAQNNLGAVYHQLGRYDEAIQAFKRATAAKSDYVEAYNNLGIIFDQLGLFQEAANAYTNVVKIKPDDADAYNNLGTAYGRLNQPKEAIRAFEKAIRIRPDFVEAHYNLGVTSLVVGNKDSALKQYEILKKLDTEKAKNLLDLIQKN